MNSTTVANKLEILFYSTIISVMSGINRLKSHTEDLSMVSVQEMSRIASDLSGLRAYTPTKTSSFNWESIQQLFLTLVLWLILGFSAGFLVGMIMPR